MSHQASYICMYLKQCYFSSTLLSFGAVSVCRRAFRGSKSGLEGAWALAADLLWDGVADEPFASWLDAHVHGMLGAEITTLLAK